VLLAQHTPTRNPPPPPLPPLNLWSRLGDDAEQKSTQLSSDWAACSSSTEQKFMEASLAYQAGKPILSDSEFDDLKGQLRMKKSKVVQQVRLGHMRPPRANGSSCCCGAGRYRGAPGGIGGGKGQSPLCMRNRERQSPLAWVQPDTSGRRLRCPASVAGSDDIRAEAGPGMSGPIL